MGRPPAVGHVPARTRAAPPVAPGAAAPAVAGSRELGGGGTGGAAASPHSRAPG